MAGNTEEVWVAVDPAGHIRAFDSYALGGTAGHWVECVTLEHAPQQREKAPQSRFPAPDAHGPDQTPTRDAGTQPRSWIAPPILTLRGKALYDPWGGGDAA